MTMANKYNQPEQKFCIVCGKELPAIKRKFCSAACKADYWMEHPQICKDCGIEFTAEKSVPRCRKCRNKHSNELKLRKRIREAKEG